MAAGRRNTDQLDHAKVCALYRHGLNRLQIAERFSCSPATISSILSSHGITSVEHPRRRYDGCGSALQSQFRASPRIGSGDRE